MRFLTEVVGNGTRQANGCYGTLMARIKYRTTTFGGITHVGRSVFLGLQPRPYSKGPSASRSPILGFLSIYAYILCHRTIKFDVVKHVGTDWRVSWRQPASHPKRVEFQGSPIFRVLLHLCLHPLTQNDQTRHARHCICTNASRGLSATA